MVDVIEAAKQIDKFGVMSRRDREVGLRSRDTENQLPQDGVGCRDAFNGIGSPKQLVHDEQMRTGVGRCRDQVQERFDFGDVVALAAHQAV